MMAKTITVVHLTSYCFVCSIALHRICWIVLKQIIIEQTRIVDVIFFLWFNIPLWDTAAWAETRNDSVTYRHISSSSSSSSSSRTDRWVHFQQNADLRLFVHTLNYCARHRWLLPVNSDIWGIFCPVFVQAILESVHCFAGYNSIW